MSRALRDPRLKLVVFGFAFLGLAFVVSLAGAAHAGEYALGLLARLRRLGLLGCTVFVLAQTAVAMAGFLPASLLGLAAGAVYGVPLGFALSAIGVLAGAAGTFGLARSALRGAILRLLARGTRFARIDRALAGDGWRLVLLMRVSPVMPFSLTSFALGLSGVSGRDYMLGTLASLPALLLYVVLGAIGVRGIAHASPGLAFTLLAIGILATGLLTVRIGRLVAGALRPAAPAPAAGTPTGAEAER
ncbi:MAG: TVP38/TMEM64 family protein [Acidiphilium sp.]